MLNECYHCGRELEVQEKGLAIFFAVLQFFAIFVFSILILSFFYGTEFVLVFSVFSFFLLNLSDTVLYSFIFTTFLFLLTAVFFVSIIFFITCLCIKKRYSFFPVLFKVLVFQFRGIYCSGQCLRQELF